jgi:DNA-binding MarR family transcriptional regulator
MARSAREGLDGVRGGLQREFPWVDAEAATAMLALVGAARRVDAWLQAVLKPLGLADSSAAVLLALALAGEPYRMTATDLNEMLVITSGGITRTVDRLAGGLLVRRVDDPGDRRRVLIELTGRGRAAAEQVLARLSESFAARARVDDDVVTVLQAFADLPRPR